MVCSEGGMHRLDEDDAPAIGRDEATALLPTERTHDPPSRERCLPVAKLHPRPRQTAPPASPAGSYYVSRRPDGAAASDSSNQTSVFGEYRHTIINKQRYRHHRRYHRHLTSHNQLPLLAMKPHLLTVAGGSNQGARNEETPLIQHADANFFFAALGSASAAAELAPAGLVLAFGQIEKTLDPGGFFAALPATITIIHVAHHDLVCDLYNAS